jgi:hypothetical protein
MGALVGDGLFCPPAPAAAIGPAPGNLGCDHHGLKLQHMEHQDDDRDIKIRTAKGNRS